MLHDLSRFVSSPIPQSHTPNQIQPLWCNRATAKSGTIRVESSPAQPKTENSDGMKCRMPLAKVVANCAKRWFLDTLKEAKVGDTSMQLLVGQMYSTGYGVPRDPQKGHAWISKASRSQSSVWKVSNEHPGYRESDSNSDEIGNQAK